MVTNKKKEKTKEVDEIEELERFFEKIDKIWYKEFGKQCPDFHPLCPQCRFALIYNKFKKEVFDEMFCS